MNVLCSICTESAALDCKNIPLMSIHKLLEMFRWFICRLGWEGSSPDKFNAWSEFLIVLLVNVTYSVTLHGAYPSSFIDLKRIANPTCASAQQFSKVLPSITVRREFFNSIRFFTVQCWPA